MIQEQYNSPEVGSVAPLVSKQAKDLTGDLLNNLSSLLETRGLISHDTIMPMRHYKRVVQIKDYANRFPKRVHERHWIDAGKNLAVVHPATLIPFFLNEIGSKICRLCDGKHSVKEILDNFRKCSSLPRGRIETDFLKFLLLIQELDLIKL